MARPWDRYIFNTLPLPHTLLLALLLTITLRIALSFHFHYGARPILTSCVVSALLASISDTLAQMVELIRSRTKAAVKLREGVLNGDIELEEKQGNASPALSPRTSFSWNAVDRPIDFDFPRMIRFMGYGFFFAPIAVSILLVAQLMKVYLATVSGFAFTRQGTGSCIVENTRRSSLYVASWSRSVFHIHDIHRGRRSESFETEVYGGRPCRESC
jgi:hypothetical protein